MRCRTAAWIAACLLVASQASAIDVFNALDDNPGTPGAESLTPDGGDQDIDLYIDTASGGPVDNGTPSLACSGPGSTGTYSCAWDMQFAATGDVVITGFTPDPGRVAVVGSDYVVSFQADAQSFRMNGGDPVNTTENGLVRIGTLHARANGSTGELRVGGESVNTTLSTDPIADTLLAFACDAAGDLDCDGIDNASDFCPQYAQTANVDSDGDGRGDECECGDQDGNATIDVGDILAINAAIFSPGSVSPLCDATNDGACNIDDILAVNSDIFSAGNTTTCSRQPVPGP
jgi:hypothetical protein